MTAIRGTFSDFKVIKTRSVCQLIIEVPIESADHALAVLGGVPQAKAEQWVGVAPVTAPESAAETAQAQTVPEATLEPKATAMWTEAKRKLVQRAALVCKEETFQQWIANGFRVMWNHERHRDKSPEERAAYHVQVSCGVKSRSDIDPGQESGARFRDLMAHYRAAMEGRSDPDLEQQRAAGP